MLRQTRKADHDAIAALFAACYPVLLAPDYAPDVLAATLPGMCKPWPDLIASGRFWCVDEGGLEAVGGWSPHPPGKADGPEHVRHFATHPEATGLGHAGAILTTCLSQARDEGFEQIECYSSLTAKGFYAQFGFKPLRNAEIPVVGVIFPVVEMRCPL